MPSRRRTTPISPSPPDSTRLEYSQPPSRTYRPRSHPSSGFWVQPLKFRLPAPPSRRRTTPIAPSSPVTTRLELPSHRRGLTGQGRVPRGFSGFSLLSLDSRRLHNEASGLGSPERLLDRETHPGRFGGLGGGQVGAITEAPTERAATSIGDRPSDQTKDVTERTTRQLHPKQPLLFDRHVPCEVVSGSEEENDGEIVRP